MGYKELIERLKKETYWCGSSGPSKRNHQIEVERRQAAEVRAEKAESERDAAVSDLETIMAYGNGNLDTCQFCKNGQCYARGGTKLCLPKWRGKKKEK